VYAFTAPWNLVYIPKILDPFTGHEAKGKMISEFTVLFQRKGYEHFEGLIEEFNEIITSPYFMNKMTESIEILKANGGYQTDEIEKLRKSVKEEFSPIEIEP
jgi:hypothetical protein